MQVINTDALKTLGDRGKLEIVTIFQWALDVVIEVAGWPEM